MDKKKLGKYVKEFVSAAHKIAEKDLVCCSCGNLSLRIDKECMLVTATTSWLGKLTEEQVVLCSIAEGKSLDGKKPSCETGFHSAVLKKRPDVNAVLHFNSPYATALSCRVPQITNFNVIPEMAEFLGGEVAIVPYYDPGTPELAAEVIKAMETHDIALLQKHGAVTVRTSLDSVIENARIFELACMIISHTGFNYQVLSDEDCKRMRRNLIDGYKYPGGITLCA
jgi:ribulose-5-phosphate 4-epimerase/fuculose-1-phosphate aldolase